MLLVFPDATPFMADQYDEAARAILPDLSITIDAPTPDTLVQALRQADGAVLFRTKVDEAVLAGCPRMKAIAFLTTGIGSWVDLDAAAQRGIVVRNVPGYADRTVAEHTLALIFACARRVAEMDRAMRRGSFQPLAYGELAGKTLAIIGVGGIGRALAPLAAGLGMRVVGWNRSPVPPGSSIEQMPLEAAFGVADIISLHLALTNETRGFMSADRLARLKPGAMLINTARGGLIDEPALVAALRSGRLAAAGLDVFASEPLDTGHALAALDNVTLTAHAGWLSPESARRLLHLGLERLRDAMREVKRS
jgi:D-3-phosphoglycerate dehydrogenase / 2-oxoglutarate reductase